MTAARRRLAVRAVFAAVLLALPVQVAVREVWSEPYPGLYQPSFGGAPRSAAVATTLEPRVDVEATDGSVTPVPFRDLLPPTPVLETTVFRSAFYSADNAAEPQTRAWLRGRVAAWRPEIDPATVTITWEDVEYALSTGERRVVRTDRVTTVDVSGSP